MQANSYLGPFLKAAAHPLADWISWEIVGVMLGAVLAAAGQRPLPPATRRRAESSAPAASASPSPAAS